jgi:RNA polymerase sigma-70 factor, ECF subfamily
MSLIGYLRRMDTYATRASLLLRLRTEDAAPRELAWAEFQDRYAPVIAGFGRKMGCKAGDIDELVQRVVVGFFEAQPRFVYDPAKGRFRGYLKTVTWRTYQRLHGTGPKTSHAEPFDDHQLHDPATSDAAVDEAWEQQWREQLLRRGIQQVRDQYQNNATFRAFELFTLLGKSVDETSQSTGLSVDGVYKAKQRITAAVKSAVDELQLLEG